MIRFIMKYIFIIYLFDVLDFNIILNFRLLRLRINQNTLHSERREYSLTNITFGGTLIATGTTWCYQPALTCILMWVHYLVRSKKGPHYYYLIPSSTISPSHGYNKKQDHKKENWSRGSVMKKLELVINFYKS